ncbi:MAG: YigZ family protein [Clostridiales bacterium]|nr:YigZ family protein [Clostridiales bacterium]
MYRYRTILQEAQAEQVIDKSRFITYVQPVETREEAEAFFSRIRAKHRDATHNVPAFVIGEHFDLQWASDDGEPQGTSGAPMVQMMVKEGITNVAVVVTRYFGGIKLGTGGLVRAYTSSARLGLEAAGLCRVEEQEVLTIQVDYSFYDKLQNLAGKQGLQLSNPVYTDKVTIEASMTPEQRPETESLLSNLTNGQGQILSSELRLVKVPE